MVGLAHTLTYGGISSSDYGIFISGEGVYNAPERNVELVSVPGRNGDLTIDKGSFANITIEYPCFTFAKSQAEFRRKVNDFKNALMSQVGYQKLADDYHPDDYRMALYINGLEVDPVHMGRAGSFTLQFICKPQRYLISGEDEVTVSDGDVINNPTLYDAEPLLMIEGYGNVGFNGYNIEITNDTVGTVYPFTDTSSTNKSNRTIEFDIPFDHPFANGDEIEFQVILTGEYGGTYTSATFDIQTGSIIPDSVYCAPNSSTHALTVQIYCDQCAFTVGTAGTLRINVLFTIVDTDNETGTCRYFARLDYDGVSNIHVTFYNNFSSAYYAPTQKSIDVGSYLCESTSTLLGHPTYIDCEIGEAYMYKEGVLYGLNSYIDLGSDLPKLSKGINTFTLSDTITSLIVVPRFWQL